MRSPRPVDRARLALGLVALARPGLPLQLSRGDPERPEQIAVRVLGARYVLQSALGVGVDAAGRRRVHAADTAVDAIHAATMLGLAVASPKHRRVALLSALAALGFSALDLHEAAR